MPSGTLIITLLLSVLIVLLFYGLLLIWRKGSFNASGETADVLMERIQARQDEIRNLQKQLSDIQGQLEETRGSNTSLREQLTHQQTLLQEERKQHQEKLDLLQNAREQMGQEFKNLANEILERKAKAFTDMNKQNIKAILNPLSEKIQSFEKKVEETYSNESKERYSLVKEIKNLQELNARISTDAVNLTNALKGDSKTQGSWGEVILERVLENSGLMKGREYEVQLSLKTEEGKSRQPDIIVHLPEKKDVIIDSKVSLTAYERYCSEDDEKKKSTFLKEHIQSIRTHIKTLSEKDYHKLKTINSLDSVMMFLPVEPAFALALQHDSDLFSDALDKNIMMVGPSNLMATLKIIQGIWRHEHQNRNALDIAEKAGKLYNKFVGFAVDMEDIGKRLNQAQDSYAEARKKLVSGKGNLVSSVEKIKELGARASKKIPDALLRDAKEDDPLLEDHSDGMKASDN